MFETCTALAGMNKVLLPLCDTFTGRVGTDEHTGSTDEERDGMTFQALMVMDENAVFGFPPTTSGTLAVLNRLGTPLQDPLSAV